MAAHIHSFGTYKSSAMILLQLVFSILFLHLISMIHDAQKIVHSFEKNIVKASL